MKMRCMAQFGADAEDLREFLPEVEGYLNAAYNIASHLKNKKFVGGGADEVPRLAADTDIPDLPEWVHEYLCDYATYLIYRNGNQARQQRGIPFLTRWQECLALIAKSDVPDRFRNLYVYEPSPPPSASDWRGVMGRPTSGFDPLGD
jgi:hypothetical protein